jgi:subtilisin family serine protease
MKRFIYILVITFMGALSCRAAALVVMERTVNLADGSGYKRDVITYNSDSKYPVIQEENIYSVNLTGTKTNLVKTTEFVGDHIIVKLKDGVTVDQLKKLNHKYGAFIRRKLLAENTFLVGVKQVDVDSVRKFERLYRVATNIVEYTEPDYMATLQDTTPNDHYFTNGLAWEKTKISCPAAWDIVTGTGGVVVAIIDTGVDYTHPDLAANIWVNPGETGIDSNGVNMATNGIDDDANGFIDDVHGWDFYNNDNDPMDDYPHGTHCAGHVAAIGNNVIGTVGIGWNIKIMALKFISGTGAGPLSDAIECFSYVTMMCSNGVNIKATSNSWIDDYSASLENAVREHRDLGVLCVAAAGNDVGNIDVNPVYPACFDLDNIISVTGTDINDDLYRDDVAVGVLNVDLSAPAKDLICTTLNGGYGLGKGTSYATPMVAGAAALIWEKAPRLSHKQVFKAIMDGVDPVASMQGKSVSGGRLNVYKALRQVIPYGWMISVK